MKVFSLFIKSSPYTFILATITGIFSGFALEQIIKTIQDAIETKMTDPEGLIMYFVGAWIVYGVTSYISVITIVKLSEGMVLQLRKTISDKVLRASFQSMEFEKNRIFTILTTDISTISNGVNRLPNMLTAAATIVALVVYMALISPELMLMFLVLLIVALLFFRLPMQKYKDQMNESREIQNKLFSYFEALVYGLKELSLSKNLRRSFKEDMLYPACEDQKNHNADAVIRVTFVSKWGEMLLLIGLGTMLIMVHYYGWGTYEKFAQFLTVALFLIPALQRVSSFLPVFGKINVALAQIDQIGLQLDSYKEETEAVQLMEPLPSEPLIKLENVTFSYFHNEEKTFFKLGPVSLEINKGEIVYLIGGNGSGKSTLAKVLCGLYKPESGKIFYAGNEITNENIDEYREYYGAIFFDFYLFEQLNHIQSTEWKERAEEYLRLLELDKKVKIEGNKLSTTSLSTGQRKRLVLLMSLLEDKPFYLFDEWAASQDPYYKNVFYNRILPDLRDMGKTLFIITHDEQYYNCADRVLLLREGQLVPESLPDDVLSFYMKER